MNAFHQITKNILFLFIISMTVVLSLALNVFFTDIKNEYLSHSFHYRITADIVYIVLIVIVLLLMIYGYQRSIIAPFQKILV
jgi:hypothetical protein